MTTPLEELRIPRKVKRKIPRIVKEDAMNKVFDVMQAINEKTEMYHEKTGKKPATLFVSRNIYRRLVEIMSFALGNLVIGCRPLSELQTSLGKLQVVIDEMLSETGIQLL